VECAARQKEGHQHLVVSFGHSSAHQSTPEPDANSGEGGSNHDRKKDQQKGAHATESIRNPAAIRNSARAGGKPLPEAGRGQIEAALGAGFAARLPQRARRQHSYPGVNTLAVVIGCL